MTCLRILYMLIISFCLVISITVDEAVARTLRIAYYSGTFDPPTLGHRDLLLRAMAAADLDLVFIMPSLTNAQKPNASPYLLRKQMVALTFSDLPNVIVPDQEIEEAFKIDRAASVLHLLLSRYPDAKFYRITGDDVISRNFNPAFANDPRLREVGMIIGQRSGDNSSKAEDLSQFDFNGRELIILPVEDDNGDSSSLARQNLLNGLHDSEIRVHPKVLEFIKDQPVYPLPWRCESLFGKAG